MNYHLVKKNYVNFGIIFKIILRQCHNFYIAEFENLNMNLLIQRKICTKGCLFLCVFSINCVYTDILNML